MVNNSKKSKQHKKRRLGQKTYLIVQNPFPSIENYKNSKTFEKFKNTKVEKYSFLRTDGIQEQFKEFKDEWPPALK